LGALSVYVFTAKYSLALRFRKSGGGRIRYVLVAYPRLAQHVSNILKEPSDVSTVS